MTQKLLVQQHKSIIPLTSQHHAVLINTDHGNIDRNFGAAKTHDAAIDLAARTLISKTLAPSQAKGSKSIRTY